MDAAMTHLQLDAWPGVTWEVTLLGVLVAALLGLLAWLEMGSRRSLREQARPQAEDPSEVGLAGLQWDHRFDCGDWLIDSQHRHLFHQAIRLALAATRSEGAATAELFKAFLPQVLQHFKDEEELMACIQYPGLPAHARCHQALVNEAWRHQDLLERGRLELPAFLDFLALDLVQGHLLDQDLGFVPLLTARTQRALASQQAVGKLPPAS
jgi:hemerythrin-like metal-binding protein